MKRIERILVVDDDTEVLSILNHTLELEGYDVVTTANGSSAVALLEKRKPDLVILDLMLPQLDGFEVLRLIRQRSSVPVIMLTARSEVNTLRDALALGADDYVSKPFRMKELLARIRAKLRRARPGVASQISWNSNCAANNAFENMSHPSLWSLEGGQNE